ncbi:ABC transporter substrate-binding protein [Bradyrhizobium sp.]|uniref:ABC transporter substrate-binding protein n=1 Tax=Bradyrhizobium sp. TaxID=376 RepID=UPI0039E512DC
MTISRRSLLIGSATLASTIGAPAVRAQSTLKIGVLGTLTGPAASWGLAIDGAVRAAAKEINDKGGLDIGGQRSILEIVAYDDQYKAAEAVTATNRLLSVDGARFIFGPVGSASMLAIKPVTEKQKALVFTLSWSAAALKDSNYIYRVGPTTQEFAYTTARWLKSNRPQVKRVATIAANDETGWNSQRIQKDAYAKSEFEIVTSELFERQQTDFSALVAKLVRANPDSIELDTTPPATAGIVIRQAREQGYKGIFTKFGGFDVAEIVRTGGAENVEGVVGILQADPASPAWARLKAAYGQFHQKEMNDYAFLFYDAARILFSAIEKAGSTNPDTVASALAALSPFPGIVGELHWGGKEAYGVDHQLYTPLFLTEIRGGTGHVIGQVALT